MDGRIVRWSFRLLMNLCQVALTADDLGTSLDSRPADMAKSYKIWRKLGENLILNFSLMYHECVTCLQYVCYMILSLILSYSTMLFAGAANAKGEDVKDLPQRVTETRPGIDWDVSGSTGVPSKLSIKLLFLFVMVKAKVRETDKSRCGSSTIGELC